jgi:hypothetical protein
VADIYSIQLIDTETIAAAGTVSSAVIPANAYKPLGNFGSQLLVGAGGGTVTVQLYTSMNDGESFVLWPYDLWTTKAAGEYSDSHGFAVCTHFYVKATVTGGTGTVVDLWMGIQ